MITSPALLTIHDKTFVPFISEAAIQDRVEALGQQISTAYADRCPLLVVVLNGAAIFGADLLKNITVPCEITFIRVASYQQTASTGELKQILGLSESIAGRDLIIVEDIVDTGLTMADVCRQMRLQDPAGIAIATLLFKPDALQEELELDYVGFEIENRFVVGYGLDYEGLGRNTKAIYVLK